MGARTLAFHTGKKVVEAQAMLDFLDRTYPIFAEWREAEVDTALLRGYMATNYGWTIHLTVRVRIGVADQVEKSSWASVVLRRAVLLQRIPAGSVRKYL
jgi:hypothetical protein